MSMVAPMTIGLDLGDRKSYYVVLDEQGEVVMSRKVLTRAPALQREFSKYPQCRVALEAGTHSGWVSGILRELCQEVLVANPRQLGLIYANSRKSDRLDAENLARLARIDPKLLKPVRHRDRQRQRDLMVLRGRDSLVRQRTDLVSTVRGLVKQFGVRIRKCSPETFAKVARGQLPVELKPAMGPLLSCIQQLTLQISHYDKQIQQLCEESYPETGVLLQIKGVGEVTALAFVLLLESPQFFRRSRDAGPFVGLVPRRRQSGDRDQQLNITKAGDKLLRRLLVNCSQYIMGPFGIDSDLRRHGEKIAARGGKKARNRAVVAVARKLAVLMLRLWTTGEVYEPLYNHQQQAA